MRLSLSLLIFVAALTVCWAAGSSDSKIVDFLNVAKRSPSLVDFLGVTTDGSPAPPEFISTKLVSNRMSDMSRRALQAQCSGSCQTCTCQAYSAGAGPCPQPANPVMEIFHAVGWCFTNGAISNPTYRSNALAAIKGNKNNHYVDGTAANDLCKKAGIHPKGAACLDYFVGRFVGVLEGSGAAIACRPGQTPSNTGNGCSCGSSPSGIPGRNKKLKTRSICPSGQTWCPVKRGGFECLDTDTNLEACGGCPGSPEAKDCSDMNGASAVTCQAGDCVATSCYAGFQLNANVCVVSP